MVWVKTAHMFPNHRSDLALRITSCSHWVELELLRLWAPEQLNSITMNIWAIASAFSIVLHPFSPLHFDHLWALKMKPSSHFQWIYILSGKWEGTRNALGIVNPRYWIICATICRTKVSQMGEQTLQMRQFICLKNDSSDKHLWEAAAGQLPKWSPLNWWHVCGLWSPKP